MEQSKISTMEAKQNERLSHLEGKVNAILGLNVLVIVLQILMNSSLV